MPARRPLSPLFWALANAGSRVRVGSPRGLPDPSTPLPAPTDLRIPTRHGSVRAVVQRPAVDDPDAPVVLQLHGGGFVNRYPEQDLHIARALADRLGAVVVLPDYDTGPRVQYPVAEEEAYDIARWLQAETGAGWSGDRLLLSGVSAGAKLAINVCQQLHTAALPAPLAVALVVPVTDVIRTDRTSGVRRPAISPFVQRFVGWAYFPDTERQREPLASPSRDSALAAAMPPTLVLTGGDDTLAPEGAELAARLRSGGVPTEHHVFVGSDHDFVAGRDRTVILETLERITDFFAVHLTPPPPEGRTAR
ncbi:alpha/beta hydrolase [Rathayibacter sp. VKM Ac-2835]|uniref:alpha/beta hydrolase n=1 Tax=Rathayibacter sp. VKM Ac-2835 TaxID=2739043 RepID=UPI0015630920|nr:alpha/beta hydrolase [Rathayibacter sp. VKM Ac-2835]